MPLYDFECEPCIYYTEVKQSVDAPDTLTCPLCNQSTLKKVFISPPYISIRGEPTTIGHLADRNTSKMGKYEKQDKEAQDTSPTDQESLKKKETHRQINAMSPERKLKWIREGD